jgi:hypothetical protein
MASCRLNKIRKIRKIMSELILTNNIGRGLTLLMKLPNVEGYSTGVHDEYYGSGSRITITLKGGFTHSFSGYGNGVKFINQAGEFAYLKWITKF